MSRVRKLLPLLPAVAFAFPLAACAATAGSFAQRAGHIGGNVGYLPQTVAQVTGTPVRSATVTADLAGDYVQRAGHVGGDVSAPPQTVTRVAHDPLRSATVAADLAADYAQRAGHIGGNVAPLPALASSGSSTAAPAAAVTGSTSRGAA